MPVRWVSEKPRTKFIAASLTALFATTANAFDVECTDPDDMNHTFTVDNSLFNIDNMGVIRSSTRIQSLVEQTYNLTVTVSDSRCTDISYVLIRLTACPEPMTYMFTSNGQYIVDVREDQNTVDSFLTVAIQGQYPRVFSIVEANARNLFVINSATGITQFLCQKKIPNRSV